MKWNYCNNPGKHPSEEIKYTSGKCPLCSAMIKIRTREKNEAARQPVIEEAECPYCEKIHDVRIACPEYARREISSPYRGYAKGEVDY